MKKLILFMGIPIVWAAGSVMAANIEFHGDLNNRFLVYTDRGDLYSGFGTIARLPDRTDGNSSAPIGAKSAPDSWGEIKYRMWGEAATDEGGIKGVYAIEVGGIRYGQTEKGGGFSGDGKNVETRWAYTDFQIPTFTRKARVRMGLMPFKINPFLWSETAMGVQLNTDSLQLSWIRGREAPTSSGGEWADSDLDSLTARYNFKMDEVKAGFFGTYMWEGLADDVGDDITDRTARAYEIKRFGDKEMSLFALGVDGSYTMPTDFGDLFFKWDAIYENGTFQDVAEVGNDYDLSAYLFHFDAGGHIGKTNITYRFWYATGDDNPDDQNFDGFISVDVDFADSIALMEGGYADDVAGTEMPYLLDKGFIMNKLSVDHKVSDKLKFGGAVLYMLTAEDVPIGNGQASNKVGLEFDAYVSYMLFPNTELAFNAGYLISDDAMDAWEVQYNGQADQNIFRSDARLRFKF